MGVIILMIFLISIPCYSIPAFPGAEGFGANATGGRGGRVVFVTNLNNSGPGSLLEAAKMTGSRYILFKVSGAIQPSERWDDNYLVQQGNVTIAGQTSPGGIIVRGLYSDDQHGSPRNVIIRHLRSREGIDQDNLRLLNTKNVIVDHCSFAWADDECAQIGYCDTVTYQNCLFSETRGEHYDRGGILIKYADAAYKLTGISFHHNTLYRIGGRMPQIDLADAWDASCNSGHFMDMDVSFNLMFDPGTFLLVKNYVLNPYGTPIEAVFNLNLINNYFFARTSFIFGMFDIITDNTQKVYLEGNKMNIYPSYKDEQLMYCCNHFYDDNPNTQHYDGVTYTKHPNFPAITYTGSGDTIRHYAIANVGAFPRDPMDRRIVSNIQSGIINTSTPLSEALADDAFDLDFDPLHPPVPPADADSDGMPDYWEEANGLNPQLQDHNGTGLSVRYTSIEGYTNLECYLNRLSDSLIYGVSTVVQGTAIEEQREAGANDILQISPNPFNPAVKITVNSKVRINGSEKADLEIYTASGKCIHKLSPYNSQLSAGISWDASAWPSGIYVIKATVGKKTLAKTAILAR